MNESTTRLSAAPIQDGGDDEADDDHRCAPGGKEEGGPRDGAEDEQEHEGADPVTRQDATGRREPEDGEAVHGRQDGHDRMLPIERVCPDRNQERRAVHERHRDTERDDAVLRDSRPGRDDHHGQEPQEGSGGDRDAESGLALGAAVELVQPLDAVVDESQRDAPENACVGIELTARPVDLVGCPRRQAQMARGRSGP